MTALYWFYAALMTLGCLTTILTIGQQRKPATPGIAVAAIVVQAPLVYLLIRAALAGV